MSWCFCNIDKKDYVLENELAFAIFDINPVSRGHMLVVPKRHCENVFETTAEEFAACHNLILECKKLLDEKFKPIGYKIEINTGTSAGQTVFHTHIHLIPFYTQCNGKKH